MVVSSPDVGLVVGGVEIQWSPAVGSFSRYEIQRFDQWTDWADIAHITDQSVGTFFDYEGRLGIVSSYRVRLVTAEGLHTPWSSEVAAPTCANGCGYTFSSNEAPELNIGYMDAYTSGPGQRDFQFLSAGEVVEHEFYMRDYQVQFRPLEERGVKFTRTIGTVGLYIPDRPGPESAARLRAIATAGLSYVCVRDESGNRWFAGVQVADAKVTNNLVSTATVTVTEVTNIPSTPDAVTP